MWPWGQKSHCRNKKDVTAKKLFAVGLRCDHAKQRSFSILVTMEVNQNSYIRRWYGFVSLNRFGKTTLLRKFAWSHQWSFSQLRTMFTGQTISTVCDCGWPDENTFHFYLTVRGFSSHWGKLISAVTTSKVACLYSCNCFCNFFLLGFPTKQFYFGFWLVTVFWTLKCVFHNVPPSHINS